ncbi:Transcription initiation factor TFIid subunit 2-like protein [Elsinoe fawcettii]|nr:Transcription initiation factor TFIid subunit 2-like protein [Elsinoe fawcettii]
MPSLEDGAGVEVPVANDFTVISQRVDLEVDFAKQTITGSTQITAQPLSKDLKAFRLNARQCRISRATIEGKPATVAHLDPYDKVKIRKGVSSVHQHDYLKSKISAHIGDRPEPELRLGLPPKVVVKELDNDGGYMARPIIKRKESDAVGPLDTPTLQAEMEQGPRFAQMKIYLEFKIESFRDGLHWIGTGDGDGRFPHVYTTNSVVPGSVSSIFPCVDDINSRYMWELSITCPKTLGDAFRKPGGPDEANVVSNEAAANETMTNASGPALKRQDEYSIVLNEDERALDLNIVCSGEMTDDVTDAGDATRRTVSFMCAVPVAARHIGFAIGPFEQVDLSAEFRHADEDDKLGQNAVKVLGYCLPGRADELRNTCLPMPKAIDYFTVTYGSFPFPNYKMCFVDDLTRDFADTAGLSICSTRLLFPESIIDTLDSHTRTLIFALATQYCGINIIPRETSDFWAVVGIAGFMSDMFMKKLAGNNEYRFRQKLASDKVFEQDVARYSLHQLGGQLDIDPSEYDFMHLKAALVLFILDRRLTKQSGSTGMNRIITRIFLNAKTGDLYNSELTTEYFLRTCEKLGHAKLDSFFKQWVYNAGCPDFMITQKFNKKKLVVEMTIQQMQSTRPRKPELIPSTFMREAKEQVSEAYAPETQPAFVGPMTIRIHEADGTPYEHIVEIKDVTTRFEIPYNTKYKRLKRSKRAKERSIAINGPEQVGESQDDVLLYCLGDTLQSEQEVKDWFLVDWTEQQENQMGQESYEWIRMDADFEWIGRMNLNMPIYMYVSQLQQDRDVVAQFESVQRIMAQEPHPMGSTILIRTLMDRRYFHGIRTTAAMGLTRLAVPAVKYLGLFHLDRAFQELYCFSDNPSMPRPNDFSDRASYLVQCTIPRAMATVRDPEGRVPVQVRKFLFDKIKFNDNTYNENNENISDNFYIATLIDCLFEAVASMAKPVNNYSFAFDDDDQPAQTEGDLFRTEALNELERYRNSDEWTPSFQNITTITAIHCLERLVVSGSGKDRTADILMYTKPDNAENVRLRAFEALVNAKLTKKAPIMKYMLSTLCDDPSPRIRDQLLRIFGQALGVVAIGDEQEAKEAGISMDIDSGLVLEQEAPTENRALEIARKSSPEAALIALKQQLENDEVFKEALWSAILSQTLSLQEMNSLLDIAALLYEPSSMQGRLILTLALPRYYQTKHIGQGKLHFARTGEVRTRPSRQHPLSQKDYKLVTDNGLKYSAPIAKPAKEAKEPPVQKPAASAAPTEEQALAAKIAEAKRELAKHKAAVQGGPRISIPTPSQMSPPPVPTPAEPVSATGGGIKLSLKRRQSVDAGRAGSPKAPKTSKNATPNGSVPGTPLHAPKSQPAPKKKEPKTPAPVEATGTIKVNSVHRPAQSTPKPRDKSKVVRLRFPTKASAVNDILQARSKSAKAQASDTTSKSDSYFPPISSSPLPTTNGAPTQPNWNAGGFRSYSVSSEAGPPIKSEEDPATALPVSSPDEIPLAVAAQQRNGGSNAGSNVGSNAPSRVASEKPDQPKPSMKIKLKIGKRPLAGGP